MPIVQFSARDLNRGKVLTPGWYRLKIEGVGEKPSADNKSTNYPVEATVICDGDSGDTTFAEVPIEWNFNSKGIGMAVPFLKAFGVDVQAGQRFDLNAAAGRELDVFIGNKEYQGRTLNDVVGQYRPVKADVTPVSK